MLLGGKKPMVCWWIWVLVNPKTLNGNAFSRSIGHVFHGLNTTFLYSALFSVDLSSNQLIGCIPKLMTSLGNWSKVPTIQYL
jgi:hypothetical protein